MAEKEKFYYIKVKEYIKDGINNDFFDFGYFDTVTGVVGETNGIQYVLETVSDRKYAKKYKYRAWAEKKIKEVYDFTKDLTYFHPYEDDIYRYKFEIVEE